MHNKALMNMSGSGSTQSKGPLCEQADRSACNTFKQGALSPAYVPSCPSRNNVCQALRLVTLLRLHSRAAAGSSTNSTTFRQDAITNTSILRLPVSPVALGRQSRRLPVYGAGSLGASLQAEQTNQASKAHLPAPAAAVARCAHGQPMSPEALLSSCKMSPGCSPRAYLTLAIAT
jgi:hypothetical protein